MIVTGQGELERRAVFKVVNIEAEQARVGNDFVIRSRGELAAKKHGREFFLMSRTASFAVSYGFGSPCFFAA